MTQSTKPQTLGYGLNNSPAGLAAWIIEKFYRWSGCHEKPEEVFTKDKLLTNLNYLLGHTNHQLRQPHLLQNGQTTGGERI